MHKFLKYIFLTCLLLKSFSSLSKAIVLLSIPKCGTHLLKKTMRLLLNGDNEYNFWYVNNAKLGDTYDRFTPITMPTAPSARFPDAVWSILSTTETDDNNYVFDARNHLPYTSEYADRLCNPQIRILFIVRDPRDFIVSFSYWMKKVPNQWPSANGVPLHDIMLDLIESGSLSYPLWRKNIFEFYKLYLDWMKLSNVRVITFENLIGPAGGGSLEKQLHEIQAIVEHCGITVTPEEIKKVAQNTWGNTPTFRKGQIGSWKTEFKTIHFEALKANQEFMQMLVDLGYEKGFSWIDKYLHK